MNFLNNCCDGIYNSLDVHFTSSCDNKCAHCIDMRFNGKGKKKPDIEAISKTIINNKEGIEDVLFLGGEPCLYIEDLLQCVKILKNKTRLKLFVTTAVPKICHEKKDIFIELISLLDGINFSVQHHDEKIADKIRGVASMYDRQSFYKNIPMKEKIRINLNIVKPCLYKKQDIIDCINHYDRMGFNSIKLSEIQHGDEYFVSFANTFGIKMKSAYTHGCQQYLETKYIFPNIKTPILLKRSCFICEKTLNASFLDGVKVMAKFFITKKNKYGVIYEEGSLEKGWV